MTPEGEVKLNKDETELLPHHQQQSLCTTRLPYRQGRKLTAVKVYSINNESKHLLIFGVPSLNLRQETKALFMRFGKLLQFNITKYPSEQFTETFHVIFDNIHDARMAKKMLDTKNYYGGTLHVCYAPELETVEETRQKILQRKTQVLGRLRNLERDAVQAKSILDDKIKEKLEEAAVKDDFSGKNVVHTEKLFMGMVNSIKLDIPKVERAGKITKMKKKVKSMDNIKNLILNKNDKDQGNTEIGTNTDGDVSKTADIAGPSNFDRLADNVEVIDCTSPNTEVVSNLADSLNYNKFGNEVIKKIPYRPLNKIKFTVNKNS